MATNLEKERKQRLKNRSQKTLLKNQRDKFLKQLQVDSSKNKAMLPNLQSTLDGLAAKGVIHKNKASRLMSRIVHKCKLSKAFI